MKKSDVFVFENHLTEVKEVIPYSYWATAVDKKVVFYSDWNIHPAIHEAYHLKYTPKELNKSKLYQVLENILINSWIKKDYPHLKKTIKEGVKKEAKEKGLLPALNFAESWLIEDKNEKALYQKIIRILKPLINSEGNKRGDLNLRITLFKKVEKLLWEDDQKEETTVEYPKETNNNEEKEEKKQNVVATSKTEKGIKKKTMKEKALGAVAKKLLTDLAEKETELTAPDISVRQEDKFRVQLSEKWYFLGKKQAIQCTRKIKKKSKEGKPHSNLSLTVIKENRLKPFCKTKKELEKKKAIIALDNSYSIHRRKEDYEKAVSFLLGLLDESRIEWEAFLFAYRVSKAPILKKFPYSASWKIEEGTNDYSACFEIKTRLRKKKTDTLVFYITDSEFKAFEEAYPLAKEIESLAKGKAFQINIKSKPDRNLFSKSFNLVGQNYSRFRKFLTDAVA